MKRCPACERTYDNDSLRFCLQDGAALVNDSEATLVLPPEAVTGRETAPTQSSGPQQQTDVPDRHRAPTIPFSKITAGGPVPQTQPISPDYAAPRKTRGTAFVVAATALATVLLISLGGLGAYLFLKNKDEAGGADSSRDGVKDNRNSSLSKNGNLTVNDNSPPSASPSAAPTPKPSAPPADAAAVTEEVKSAVNGWAASVVRRDVSGRMSYYADTLETYYKAQNVPASRVRADLERALAAYSELKIQVGNVRVVPDSTGQRATATFDKTWNFQGAKTSSGSVQQQLKLEKIGGRWRITSEKELQIYYLDR